MTQIQAPPDVRRGAGPLGPAPRRRRRRPTLAEWLVLVPVVVAAVFFAYPLWQMLQLSFTDFVQEPGEALDNYKWFLGTEVQRTILIRTVNVSLLVTAVCLAISYPYAYAMTVVGPKVRLLMLAAVMLPFWTSLLVRLYAWVILLQGSGPVNQALEGAGMERLDILGTTTAVVIGSVHILMPFFVLPLYATLVRIDRRLLDAAVSLGAKPWSAFVRIYLPLSVPGMLAGSTIVFIYMMGFYFTPAFLGSSRHTLVSEQIVTQIRQILAFGRGGAMAAVVLLLTFAILGLAALLSRPLTRSLQQRGHHD